MADNSVQVDVWAFSMKALARCAAGLRGVLSVAERARTARLRTVHLRACHEARTVVLRCILARYTGIAPADLCIEPGAAGKPALTDLDPPCIWFNMSHTGDRCVIAVSDSGELGVDIESFAINFRWEPLARHFFHREEVRELKALPEDERIAAFFRVWTRKEAYIKALGLGMSHGLDQFHVSAAPEGRARLLVSGLASEEPAQWLLRDFQRQDRVFGALAVRGRDLVVRQAAWGAAEAGEPLGDGLEAAILAAPLMPVREQDGTLHVAL